MFWDMHGPSAPVGLWHVGLCLLQEEGQSFFSLIPTRGRKGYVNRPLCPGGATLCGTEAGSVLAEQLRSCGVSESGNNKSNASAVPKRGAGKQQGLGSCPAKEA